MLIRKLTALLMTVILLLGSVSTVFAADALVAAGTAAGKDAGDEVYNPEFDEYMQQMFVDALDGDYISTHILLEHPENYGLDVSDWEISLGYIRDDEFYTMLRESYEEEIEALKEFDYESLSDFQKDVYDLYMFQLEIGQELADEKFDYYQNEYASMDGNHYAIATMLSDWILREEEDVPYMIALVEDVLPYITETLEYTAIQEEKGLMMICLDEIVDYCQSILDSGMDSSVLASMEASIDALELEEEKADAYKEELEKAFEESFLPGYQLIIDKLTELEARGNNNTLGLAALPNGAEYYELLLQEASGVRMPLSDMMVWIGNMADEFMNDLIAMVMKDPTIYEAVFGDDYPEVDFSSYEEMLEMVYAAMQNDFPQIGEIEYNIENMDEEIASNSGIAAYFNTPALDSTTPKQMKVNPLNSDFTDYDVFGTVCHEGFPGHMYQIAYMYENVDSDFVKVMGDLLAYTEGWAVYASYEAANYLEDIKPEVLIGLRNIEIYSYLAIIIMDAGIHYSGWDLEEFNEMATQLGFGMDEEDAKAQYYQLQSNPAAFQPYYVGYLQFYQLREKAEEALGDKFDLQAFHEALLQSGTMPFFVVERNVDKYIADNQ